MKTNEEKTLFINDVISKGKIENQIYSLPDIQLDRKDYLMIAEHLKFLGGKWKRNKNGFAFVPNL